MSGIKNKAGVVVYRTNNIGEIEVLLISARKFKNTWVFPVGTVERGETAEEAAVRECMEESGYIVKLEEKLGSFIREKTNGEGVFTFFSGHIIGETDDYEKDRKRIWVKLKHLHEKVYDFLLQVVKSFKSTKDL